MSKLNTDGPWKDCSTSEWVFWVVSAVVIDVRLYLNSNDTWGSRSEAWEFGSEDEAIVWTEDYLKEHPGFGYEITLWEVQSTRRTRKKVVQE